MNEEIDKGVRLIAEKYASELANSLLASYKTTYQLGYLDALIQLDQEAAGRSANELAAAIKEKIKELEANK